MLVAIKSFLSIDFINQKIEMIKRLIRFFIKIFKIYRKKYRIIDKIY